MRPGSVQYAISDQSMVSEARRAALGLAAQTGMSEQDAGGVALVATELCTNLLKHASGGTLIISWSARCLDLVAIDRGPGMTSIEACFRDGYSTAGSPGTGLGAVSRMSSAHDVYSRPGHGTIVWAGFGQRDSGFEATGISVPHPGEAVCGDGWYVRATDTGVAALAVDGLGHGPLAASAADQAVEVFRESTWRGAEAALEDIHIALRATRGAAVAVADLDFSRGSVAYAGLGNISGSIVVPGATSSRHLVSHNGTAGLNARRISSFSYAWTPGSSLILCSDGLSTHWTLEALPEIAFRAPAVVAAGLYREFSRGRDDATVVIVRER